MESTSIPTPCATSTGGSATSACAPTASDQYVEVAGEFARYADDDPYVDRRLHPRRRSPTRSRSWSSAAASAAMLGGPPARGGGQRHPHHRGRRRLRRHLVLEPLSRRAVRHRELLLPAAAGRDWATCRRRSTPSRRRSSSTAQRIGRRLSTSTTVACFQTRVTELRWDEAIKRWHRQHQPRRRHQGALRDHGDRAGQPAEAARHSRHRGLRGPHLPHQPLGLRLHRRRHQRQPDKLADKRVAIIGTGATAIQCVPYVGAVRRAPLRLPAHALVRRPARQQADRSGLGGDPEARLAARAARELRRHRHRAGRSRRTWSTTAGPTSSATSVVASARADRPMFAGGDRAQDGAGRLPEDEPDPRAGGRNGEGSSAPPRR